MNAETAVLIGLAAFAAGVLGLCILRRPIIGLYLLVSLIPLENILWVNPNFGALKGVGMLTFAAWITGKSVRGESISLRSMYLVKPGFLFVTFALMSLAWADYPWACLSGAFSLLQWMLLVVLVVDQATTWERLERMIVAALPTSVLSMVFATRQVISGEVVRAGGLLVGPNAFAVSLSVLLPFAVFFAAQLTVRVRTLLAWLFVSMAVSNVLFSLSRSAMLITPVIVVAQLFAMRGTRRAMSVVLMTCGLALALAVVPWAKVSHRFKLTWQEPLQGRSARLLQWRGAAEIFLDNPLLGVGYDNYGYHFGMAYQYHIQGRFREFGSIRAVHNFYLSTLADLGIVGFGLLAWLIIRALRNVMYTVTRPRGFLPEGRRQFNIAIGLSLLSYLAFNFFFNVESDKLFWVVLGMTEAARRLIRRQELAQELVPKASGVPVPLKVLHGGETHAT